MELPLPAHDPGARRRRPARGRPRPRRLRPVRQARAAHRLHLRPPRRLDVVARLRRARPPRHHPRRARTGVACSGCASSPSNPTASRASSRPTRSCRPATAPRRRLPRLAAASPRRRPSCPIGRIVNGGCTTDLARGRDRRLRRAVPRRDLQGGRAPVPDARADVARRSRGAGQPRRVGGAAHLRAPVPVRVQRPGPDHRRRRAAPDRARSPARRASRTPRSRAAATSSRRTVARSSHRS